MNRFITEPHIFCLSIIIARFALYYDFEMTNNLLLNLFIGLLISKKFFTILPMLTFRLKLNVFYTHYIDIWEKLPPLIQTIFMFIRMYIINPNNCYFIPTYLYSLIAGSPIHFVAMGSYFTLPSSPRQNSFWDYDDKETINEKNHFIENIVYYSHLNSFKNKLYNMVKNGQLGIVNEDSFYLFYSKDNDYAILCHIIAINSFSIDFQIRCARFIMNSNKYHYYEEIGFLYELSECNYLRCANIEKTPLILKSVISPVAQNIELDGYQHLMIDIKYIDKNLSYEKEKIWLSYALISFFHNNENKFYLSELFDYQIPDRNTDTNDNQLDNNIFNLFEFKGSKRRIYNFLNVIYRELLRLPLFILSHDQDEFKFSDYFPLFHHKNIDHHDTDTTSTTDTDDSEYNIESESDSETQNNNSDDVSKLFTEEKVRWLIFESLKRSYLYKGLAFLNLTPDLEDLEEVKEFVKYSENKYQYTELSSNWKELINPSNNYNNNDTNDDDDDYSINLELLENEDDISTSKHLKTMYTIDFNDDKMYLFQNSQSNNWTVFKVHKEMVKSVWISCCACYFWLDHIYYYFFFCNYFRLQYLLSQFSSLPEAEPAYISDIEKSTFI